MKLGCGKNRLMGWEGGRRCRHLPRPAASPSPAHSAHRCRPTPTCRRPPGAAPARARPAPPLLRWHQGRLPPPPRGRPAHAGCGLPSCPRCRSPVEGDRESRLGVRGVREPYTGGPAAHQSPVEGEAQGRCASCCSRKQNRAGGQILASTGMIASSAAIASLA